MSAGYGSRTSALLLSVVGRAVNWPVSIRSVMSQAANLLICSVLLACGCRVSKPSEVESRIAKEVKRRMTVRGKDVRNPVPSTEDSVAEGREHFSHHCAICHGLDGQAYGVPFADKMGPPVPDLMSKDIQDYADGQLKSIISDGINPSGMPAWKGILNDDEMWSIVNYIRHLPPKASLGIPAVYREEQEEHEHMHGQPKQSHESGAHGPAREK